MYIYIYRCNISVYPAFLVLRQERLYEVTLVKADGSKLGLDVDYMAERKVLPIMHVTGGREMPS